jgi:hypothetical protein
MGVNITNDNIDEFLTSYIDGQNKDSNTDKEIRRFIENDEVIAKKYMSEVLTKKLFSARLAMVEVPASLAAKINNSIDSYIHSAAEKHSVLSDNRQYYPDNFWVYLKTLVTAPVRIKRLSVPRYAFAVVFLFVLAGAGLLMQKESTELNPFIAAGSEKSVMVQAMKTFHKILSGDVEPEMKSDDVNRVKTFCKVKTNIDAFVPVIDDYDLVGALCNEYNGQKLVHLVYTSGSEIIYIYEIGVSSLHCKELELPEPVHYDILKNKYYMCDKVDGNKCTMILWYNGDILCASVSTMSKQKMYASFTSFR